MTVAGNPWFLLLLATFTTARLTRLIFKDTIFTVPREALLEALQDPVTVKKMKGKKDDEVIRRRGWSIYLRNKLAELIICPYCNSAYTAAATLLGIRIFVTDFEAPVLWWFATWFGAIVFLEWTDGGPEHKPRK
jgi:hypothetical protein